MLEFDLTRARRETPGCQNVLHLNNAGASLMPQSVLDAVIGHLELEACIGGYEAADQAIDALEACYDLAAELINCHRDEIAMIENATRAWDMAFYSIPFKPGDRILTAKASYASNYIAFLQRAKRDGITIDVIPDDEYGQLSVQALQKMFDDDVKLVAITHVPTNGGLVNPAMEVGDFIRQTNAYYLLDACQSAGQMPIDVEVIGCDMLSTTGRKYLRGPRGTGFLYVRREVLDQLEPPFLDLHSAIWVSKESYQMEGTSRRFENWESNVAGRVGLGVAIDYALQWGLDAIWYRVKTLAEDLRNGLRQIPGVTVHDLGKVKSGIVTFSVEGLGPTVIQQKLRRDGINVCTSTVFSTRLDMEGRGLDEIVRASVHYYNSEEELERFTEAIATLDK